MTGESPRRVPVLIAGGGPVGLAAALAWSDQAVFTTGLLGREVTRFSGCFGLDLAGDDRVAEPGQQIPQPAVEQVIACMTAFYPARLRGTGLGTGLGVGRLGAVAGPSYVAVDIRAFHHRFAEEGVEVQQEVTHGNAFGIYFFDAEGNRNEVYLRIDRDVPQPFRKSIDFGLPPEEIYAEAERLLDDGGPAYRPVQ